MFFQGLFLVRVKKCHIFNSVVYNEKPVDWLNLFIDLLEFGSGVVVVKGSDAFVLDMVEPMFIVDLAKKMIHISGLEVKDELNPNGDIEIEFTGLRLVETLYEELLIGDNVSETDNPMIMRAEKEILAWDDLKLIIDELSEAIDYFDHDRLRQLLIKAVPGFKPQC